MSKKSPAKSPASSPKLTNKSSTKRASAAAQQPLAAAAKTAAKPAARSAASPRPNKGASPPPMSAPSGQRPPAPDFALTRDGGSTLSLRDFAGRKLVLFFYPKADTPGCTREAMDFNRLRRSFDSADTSIIGISADSPAAQQKFKVKHGLDLPMIADETRQVIDAYGAWGQKSLYGRTFDGILRTTVLIDANGRIAQTWRNVRVDGHAEAVLVAATALDASSD